MTQQREAKQGESGSGKGKSNTGRWMVMADPIHGIIQLDRHYEPHRLLLDVINSRSFQRLRRIKQMGLAEYVFPGATHNRFVHSLGAMYLMLQVIENLKRSPQTKALLLSEYEATGCTLETLLLLGILIHDIGHTPLSHTLEDILELDKTNLLHDEYWNCKILREDPDLVKVWQKYNPKLPDAVLAFMGHGATGEAVKKKHFLAALVSSQLDMDRLDYLQRDSHFLGVQYGRIEAQRILVNLEVDALADGTPAVVVREEALPAVEHYLFGRFQAYKMALHSLDKASEATLKKTLQRFRWVREQGLNPGNPAESLFRLMTAPDALSTLDFLRMDDGYLWQVIQDWADQAEDELLKSLSNRFLRHDIFKFSDLQKLERVPSEAEWATILTQLEQYYVERGLSFEFGFEYLQMPPKPMYQSVNTKEPIWMKTAHGILDLKVVTTLPLALPTIPQRAYKQLVFVWDREAVKYLDGLLAALL